jgi:hypothetical protein
MAMNAAKPRIMSIFQGIPRLAAVGIALVALGYPSAAMATPERPGGFSASAKAKYGRYGWAGQEHPGEISLSRSREASRRGIAKSVFATSLFRHVLDWKRDDDDHSDRRERFARVIRDLFAWKLKQHGDDIRPIPEPGTGLLLAMGLTALGLRRRR